MNSKQLASWSKAVAQQAASGQSEAEWCQVHEIKLSTVIYWRRRAATPFLVERPEIQVKTPSVKRAPAKSRSALLSPDAAVDSGVVLEAGSEAEARLKILQNKQKVGETYLVHGTYTQAARADILRELFESQKIVREFFAAKLLPYRGLGSSLLRVLREWPHIELIDDRAGNLFKVIVARPETVARHSS